MVQRGVGHYLDHFGKNWTIDLKGLSDALLPDGGIHYLKPEGFDVKGYLASLGFGGVIDDKAGAEGKIRIAGIYERWNIDIYTHWKSGTLDIKGLLKAYGFDSFLKYFGVTGIVGALVPIKVDVVGYLNDFDLGWIPVLFKDGYLDLKTILTYLGVGDIMDYYNHETGYLDVEGVLAYIHLEGTAHYYDAKTGILDFAGLLAHLPVPVNGALAYWSPDFVVDLVGLMKFHGIDFATKEVNLYEHMKAAGTDDILAAELMTMGAADLETTNADLARLAAVYKGYLETPGFVAGLIKYPGLDINVKLGGMLSTTTNYDEKYAKWEYKPKLYGL